MTNVFHPLFLHDFLFVFAALVVIVKMAERFGRDRGCIGEHHATVAAGREHQLIVEMIVTDAPHPEIGRTREDVTELSGISRVEVRETNVANLPILNYNEQ